MRPRWTAEPGSRLASLRQQAHRALDVYWEFGLVSRKQCYAWLARQMKMRRYDCHFGMFDEADCERALQILRRGGPV